MTRALPQIQRSAPGITLQIMPLRTDALEQGDADLSIVPQQILAKDHPFEVLFQDEFVCIACAKNKLIGKSLSQRDYLSLGHVAVRFGEQQEVPSLEEGQGRRSDRRNSGNRTGNGRRTQRERCVVRPRNGAQGIQRG